MHSGRLKVAVVGHVEWVQFARVPHVPRAGEIIHARDTFEEPAGGGAVAAVQLARLAGSGAANSESAANLRHSIEQARAGLLSTVSEVDA